MLPKYWPSASRSPMIATSISNVPPVATLQSGDVTAIVAPAGALMLAEKVWADPLTFLP